MKRVAASEARRRWFEILDRVAAGESIVIERKGRRIVIRREETPAGEVPDYSEIIRPRDTVEDADRWSWEWDEEELRSVTRPK